MRRLRISPMDLADASLVVLAEESSAKAAFSPPMRARLRSYYRWKNRKPFVNLLLAD